MNAYELNSIQHSCHMARPILPFLLFACLLDGCAARLGYEPPALWTPATWRSTAIANAGITTDPVAPEWWLAFNDPVLTSLMRRAVGNAGVRAVLARMVPDRPPRTQDVEARRAALVQVRSEAAQGYMRLRCIQARLRLPRGPDPAVLELAEAQQINAIGLSLGLPPGALDAELRPPAPVPPAPSRVSAGLPSELARRRPDIRLAELALQAAGPDEARAAATAYQDAVLRAFTQVDDAMLAYGAALRRRPSKALEVAERDAAVSASLVALYAALGAGWEAPAAPSPPGRGPG